MDHDLNSLVGLTAFDNLDQQARVIAMQKKIAELNKVTAAEIETLQE